MSESAVLVLVLAAVALVVAGYTIRWAVGMLIAFTRFVLDLHVVVILMLFVLFPPALLAFLAGMALAKFRGEPV